MGLGVLGSFDFSGFCLDGIAWAFDWECWVRNEGLCMLIV